MTEELTFHLEEFEGPLELLLALVSKHKMDLHNIPILELIDQYTRTVEAAQAVDPDISSSFIEMAAHLVEMKSYLLLPRSTEGERMKQELTGQLIEYDQCRRMASALRAAAKEAKRPKKETAPRRKAKLTLNILVTILRGAGRLTKAVFGSLRVTKIRVCLGVRGEDPAEAARAYGRLNAWLYSSLGVIDRFVYLDFDELRILPDFGSAEPTVADRVSFHLSARLLFIVAAALRVLYEFWREKVLDVFL